MGLVRAILFLECDTRGPGGVAHVYGVASVASSARMLE